MTIQEATKLPKEFFDCLKKYQEIMAITDDEKFKKFAPNFVGADLMARAKEINDYLPRLQKTINCLKNYWSNLTHYELAVDEKNWLYTSVEQMEQNLKVYQFLLKNYNRKKREVSIKIYTARYNKLVDEYNSIMTVGKNEANTEYLCKLPELYASMERAVCLLSSFAQNNPNDKFVKTHRLTPEKVDVKYILKKWDKLVALDPEQSGLQPGSN